MTPIWTDQYLNQLIQDAVEDINHEVPSVYHRFYLATVVGQSVYTLPDFVKTVKRITWRGRKLEEVSWFELQTYYSQGTAVVDNTTRIETANSTPYYYAFHPTNILDIRFFPTPADVFLSSGGDPFSPLQGESRCIISCWRTIDQTNPLFDLPTWIKRRTFKAYALWRAFEKEGKGQNSKASQYYKTLYDFLIQNFTSINSGCYLAMRYSLESYLETSVHNRAKPAYPSNFERVIIR